MCHAVTQFSAYDDAHPFSEVPGVTFLAQLFAVAPHWLKLAYVLRSFARNWITRVSTAQTTLQ